MNPDRRVMSRREFLIAAGCGCAATLLVGSGCSRTGATTAAATVCPYGYRFDPWPGQCYRYVDSNGSGYCDFSEPVLTTTSAGTTTKGATSATAGSAAVDTTTGATANTTTVLCDRHCQAPGQCARFVDSDGSSYCDLSEGVVAAPTTTTAATPAATAATSGSAATAATATPAATATAAATATTAAAVQLVQLCDRGCRTPGSCGRFTDSNGSGICDLYEGVPADQAASYGGASGGRGRRGG